MQLRVLLQAKFLRGVPPRRHQPLPNDATIGAYSLKLEECESPHATLYLRVPLRPINGINARGQTSWPFDILGIQSGRGLRVSGN